MYVLSTVDYIPNTFGFQAQKSTCGGQFKLFYLLHLSAFGIKNKDRAATYTQRQPNIYSVLIADKALRLIARLAGKYPASTPIIVANIIPSIESHGGIRLKFEV